MMLQDGDKFPTVVDQCSLSLFAYSLLMRRKNINHFLLLNEAECLKTKYIYCVVVFERPWLEFVSCIFWFHSSGTWNRKKIASMELGVIGQRECGLGGGH